MDYLRLPITFDVGRMLGELQSIERNAAWLQHPDYTVASAGDWTALALLSATTNVTDARSLRYHRGDVARPTELLLQCPYLGEVIKSFETEIHRARLMNLKPGTNISEHRDYGQQRYSLERGFIRVHIPIRTHERVYFCINRRALPMKAGEAWYTNVCEPHAVRNDSDVHRVHLVLDMRVNEWVRSLFPSQGMLSKARGVVLRHCERRWLSMRQHVLSFPRRIYRLIFS
jgi:hypothetical protein